MTTRSFLVNLLEIVDEARLRIPIVRDIKLPGFWLVMECFLPSTPPLAVLLSLSLFHIRSLVYSLPLVTEVTFATKPYKSIGLSAC